MKPITSPKPRLNPLYHLIRDATGAPNKDLGRIESIMRDEIFHSTLDWQNREQLVSAARKAHVRLNQDRDLYDLDHDCRVAMFYCLKTETAARENNSPDNRMALMAATNRYEAAKTILSARLDKVETD